MEEKIIKVEEVINVCQLKQVENILHSSEVINQLKESLTNILANSIDCEDLHIMKAVVGRAGVSNIIEAQLKKVMDECVYNQAISDAVMKVK